MSLKKPFLLFLTFCAVAAGHGQSCNGSLGDPVLNIDFGAGNNPGPSLIKVPAPYQNANQDCPPEGYYSVRSSSFFCFNSTWHVVPFDHTPNDPNGYFLIVNASGGPSDIYIDTIRGLCLNTSFEMNAWILNMLTPTGCGGNGIDPNLTFTVTDLSGNLLAQYNTGNLAENSVVNWTSHRFMFNTSAASGDVILKIRSMAPGGCGNEFALDDITLRPCGPNITTAFANNPARQVQVCEDATQSFLLTASFSNTYQNPVFQWQVSINQGISWSDIPGATGFNYLRTPTATGEYWYRITIAEGNLANFPGCRFASGELKVFVMAKPFAQATNYVYGCYGSTVYLFAAGGSSYEWTGPNGYYSALQGPQIQNVNFGHTGTYIVKVTTGAGCSAFDSTGLIIYPAPTAKLTPVEASICEGDSVQLLAGGSIRYQWLPSKGLTNDTIPNPYAKPTDNIIYTVRVYNEYTCYDKASITITVWKKPKAFAGPDKFVRKGRSVKLEGSVKGTDISYNWTPPDYLDNPQLVQPRAGPPSEFIYRLEVISNRGCGTSIDEVKVEVIDKLFIPTAFTPNGDGLNDNWEIVTFEDYPKAKVEVFNRYGQVVYRGFGKNYQPWDGKFKGDPPLPGVYVYAINLGNNTAILKGTLTIIR